METILIHFGKPFHLQESTENTETIALLKANWEKTGHTVVRYKDKSNKNLIHVYASRFRTKPL